MTQRIAVGLTVVNLVLLLMLLAQMRPVTAQGAPGLLRGTGLEIVDEQGRVRAAISILAPNPAVAATDGRPFPETVVLRLIDPKYGPVVKLSGSERSAGLGQMECLSFKVSEFFLEAPHAPRASRGS